MKKDNNINLTKENNYLFKEINELLLAEDEISKNIINKNKDFIELELSIPEIFTQSEYPIKFILKLSMNYPEEEPELFCITKFSYPHIYDGRNLIEDVLKSKWKKNAYTLDTIINKIPKFIVEFNSSLEDGYLLLVGKFMLNHNYSTERIKSFPIFVLNVKENKRINNKITHTKKILTISDLSFCLYEKESKKFSKLTFYNNLNNLISIKRNTQQNTITLIWKEIDNDKDKIEIELSTDETEKIKIMLLEKMELFGKEYNVNQKIIKKRMGKLPLTDIEKVEKQIKAIEKDFENKNINMAIVNQLMSLYQKAVEYYSAINSPQFKVYTDKIKELMATEKINELIDKSKEESNKTENNNINPPKIKKVEKEEKILSQGLSKIKNKLNSLSSKKEKKKQHMPKVALSKEDEDGETLDVGPDDEEEEEEDDEEKENEEEKNNNLEKEDVKNEDAKKEDIKEEKLKELNEEKKENI